MSTQTLQDYEPPLNLEEGAKLLRVSLKTLRRFIEKKTLRAFKIGGRWFILGSEIQTYLQHQITRGGGHK